MKELGFIVMLFGIACADSDNLLIPFAAVMAGTLLILIGIKK